eukprot:UN01404
MFRLLLSLSALGLGNRAVLGNHIERHVRPIPNNTPDNCAACIVSCFGVVDGDYSSCNSCHYFASCSNGAIIDDRERAAGTVWDDLNKVCDYFSHCETPPVECDVVDPNAPQMLLTPMSGEYRWVSDDGGNMFDICALSDATTVTITKVDTHCLTRTDPPATSTVHIFAATAANQRYSAISLLAAQWTLVHQQTVTCAPQYTLTELDPFMNINGGVVINGGECRGFFVAVTHGTTIFNAGVDVGSVYASNADIQLLTGTGKGYDDGFNSDSYEPYSWEGQIHYTVDNTPSVCGDCVDDCYRVADGDYESCSNSDAVYASCWADGHLLDNRPCPQGLVWD